MGTPAEMAWLAGIFEGEGTFETSKRSTARMTIAMSDKDVIERIERIFPSGCPIAIRDDEPNRKRFVDPKPLYVWRLGNGEQITAVITELLPWFGERRAQRAREVLAHIDRRQKAGEPRSSHCKQGHALTPDNLVRRGGAKPYVRCKTCSVERERAYRARRRVPSTD